MLLLLFLCTVYIPVFRSRLFMLLIIISMVYIVCLFLYLPTEEPEPVVEQGKPEGQVSFQPFVCFCFVQGIQLFLNENPNLYKQTL